MESLDDWYTRRVTERGVEGCFPVVRSVYCVIETPLFGWAGNGIDRIVGTRSQQRISVLHYGVFVETVITDPGHGPNL
jgi:hypothetical protein